MRAHLILREKTAKEAKGFCNALTLKKPLPHPKIGRGLPDALTKKMAADSQTEADVPTATGIYVIRRVQGQIGHLFRKSLELLRHFFRLRSVFIETPDGNGGAGQSE